MRIQDTFTMKGRTLSRRALISLLFVTICTVFILGSSSPRQPKVIIVQDEMPQMEVLAKFLRE